jgi:hypothetical protein
MNESLMHFGIAGVIDMKAGVFLDFPHYFSVSLTSAYLTAGSFAVSIY